MSTPETVLRAIELRFKFKIVDAIRDNMITFVTQIFSRLLVSQEDVAETAARFEMVLQAPLFSVFLEISLFQNVYI